ncbi:unnamed protein product [Mucor hiemalis]
MDRNSNNFLPYTEMKLSLSQTIFFALMAFSGIVYSAPAPQAPTEVTPTQSQQAIKDSHLESQPVNSFSRLLTAEEIAKFLFPHLPYRNAPDEAAYLPPAEMQVSPITSGEAPAVQGALAAQGAPTAQGAPAAAEGDLATQGVLTSGGAVNTGPGVPSPPEGFPSTPERFPSGRVAPFDPAGSASPAA